jgi:hypothetical protein
MGLFLSGGISEGLVLLAEMLDPAIRSVKDITRITGAEPLALIPLMLSDEDYSKKGRSRKRLIIFAALLVVSMFGIVHYFVLSLDIVWFKVLAKINML